MTHKTIRSLVGTSFQLFALSLLLTVFRLNANPIGYRSLPSLVNSSDLVAKARLIRVTPPSAGAQGSLLVSFSEILKGASVSGSRSISFEGTAYGGDAHLVGKQVLIFAATDRDHEGLKLVPLVDGVADLQQQIFRIYEKKDYGLGVAPRDTALQKVIKIMAGSVLNSGDLEGLSYLMPLAWSRVEPELTSKICKIMTGEANLKVSGIACLESLDGKGM